MNPTPAVGGARTGTDRVARRGSGAETVIRVMVEADLSLAPDGEATAARLCELAREVLASEGVEGPAELSLGFIDEAEMAALNERWMGHAGPTDVLAWPLDGGEAVAGGVPLPGVPTLLGDVVVCPAVAGRQAAVAGHGLEAELALLVVHGVLHVLGYDHAEPAEEAAMRAREAAHLVRSYDPRWTRPTP